jgi:protein TonB
MQSFFYKMLVFSLAAHLALLVPMPGLQISTEAPGGKSQALRLGLQQQSEQIPQQMREARQTQAQRQYEVLYTSAQSERQVLAVNENTEERSLLETILTQDETLGEQNDIVVTREARFASRPVPPQYPEQARRRKQEGTVLIGVLVNEQGKTQDVRVVQSSGHNVLDEAALTAIKAWDFLPANKQGKNITAWVHIPLDFNLRLS